MNSTSKLASKPSRRERPKSSERQPTKEGRNRRSKDAGTPEKSGSPPIGSGVESNSPVPMITSHDDIEAIQSLLINIENLKSVKFPHPPQVYKPSTKILVRKAIPKSQLPKQTKIITLAKKAPPDAPIKLPEPEDFPGLPIGENGILRSHSILGTLDDFRKAATRRGESPGIAKSPAFEVPPSTLPGTSPSAGKKISGREDVHLNETKALKNWEMKMKQRSKQQEYISRTMSMPTDMLIMNQSDDYRLTQEERTLIDRAIPSMDYGKGYRVGSEFWKQVEKIGCDATGVSMTLTQTEKGYAQPIEHVGKPVTVKHEMGISWRQTRRVANVHYPWWKSSYLQNRKAQLNRVIEELDPHKPYLDGLEVIGYSLAKEHQDERSEFDDTMAEEGTGKGVSNLDDYSRDPLANYEDVVPPPIFGPSLVINGHSAGWTGSAYDKIDHVGLIIRLLFESPTGESSSSDINITNDGTAAVYYSWKKVDIKDPFGLKKGRPLQRFYFNMGNGVILPGDSLRVPFFFKSPNAGIFSETWQLETHPVLFGGAAINIVLRGISTEEDVNEQKRKQMTAELERRQKQHFVERIIDEILQGVRTPPRPSTPEDTYLTEEEMFARQNGKMIFNSEAIKELKFFHEQLNPEQDWDMSVNALVEAARNVEEEEVKENMLQKLNADVDLLSLTAQIPVQKPAYDACYQLLCQTIDKITNQASALRSRLGMPEMEFVQEVPLEEVTKKSKRGLSQDTQRAGTDKKPTTLKDKKGAREERPTSSIRSKISANAKTRSRDTVMSSAKQTPGDISNQDKQSALGTEALASLSASEYELYSKYYERLYTQVYGALSDMADNIETIALHQHLAVNL